MKSRFPFEVAAAKAALAVGLLGWATQVHAVRPFVTDDARIIDHGQIEMESWFETGRSHGEWDPAPGFNVIVGSSFNEWLEVLAGSGVGNDPNGGSSVVNPMLMSKILLRKAEVDGQAGFAFSAGTTFNRGHGSMHDDGRVSSVLGMSTLRLKDDDINIHINLGWRTDNERGFEKRTRAYWGLGTDIQTPNQKIRFVGEVFAGDPLILNAPKIAMQTGLRWMQSDYMQMDVTFGVEPNVDRNLRRTGGYEFSAQLGIRMLFDAFTPGGRPGRHDGASGIFR